MYVFFLNIAALVASQQLPRKFKTCAPACCRTSTKAGRSKVVRTVPMPRRINSSLTTFSSTHRCGCVQNA